MMTRKRTVMACTGAAMALVCTPAAAQDNWQDRDISSLRGETQQRYDAALALTNDAAVAAANDPRFIWASEAKVQCGIALGYLKSRTRDAVSLGKCRDAYARMTEAPRPVAPPPPPPPPRAEACDTELPGLIFFEFDSAVPGAEAAQIADYVAQNAAPCSWRTFNVVGHADRSGSNAYNMGLSQRRADAVAGLLGARGIAMGSIETTARGEESPRVPTADGVRELQNRRVEILVNE